MPWYVYPICFFIGAFAANGIPHLVEGVAGRPFPSPFSKPPGVGDSSPLVNAIWGWANVVVAGVLAWIFEPRGASAGLGWIVVAIGALTMAVFLARHFGHVRAQRARG